MSHDSLKFFLGEHPLSQRHLPVKASDGLLRDHTLARAARHGDGQLRLEEIAEALGEHDAGAEQLERRHGVKEKVAQSVLRERRRLAL